MIPAAGRLFPPKCLAAEKNCPAQAISVQITSGLWPYAGQCRFHARKHPAPLSCFCLTPILNSLVILSFLLSCRYVLSEPRLIKHFPHQSRESAAPGEIMQFLLLGRLSPGNSFILRSRSPGRGSCSGSVLSLQLPLDHQIADEISRRSAPSSPDRRYTASAGSDSRRIS